MNPESLSLTPTRLLELHHLGGQFGALGGTEPQVGCLDGVIGKSVLNTSFHTPMDEPVENLDPLILAAYFLRSVAVDQCFMDGNKRLAWLSAVEILQVYANSTLNVSNEEAYAFVIHVVVDNCDIPEITEWMAEHLIAA